MGKWRYSLTHIWNSTSGLFIPGKKIIRRPFEKRQEGPRRRIGCFGKRGKKHLSVWFSGYDTLPLKGVSPDFKFHQTLSTTSVCYTRVFLMFCNTGRQMAAVILVVMRQSRDSYASAVIAVKQWKGIYESVNTAASCVADNFYQTVS
jgi:hypothetical protein